MIAPDWTTLKIFLATVEHGSVTRAAARCGTVTSAAAKRLQVLEQQFEVSILERGPRGTRPTAAGEVLLRHARAMSELNARLADDMAALATGGLGSVRLHATASSLSGHALAEVLADFAQAQPCIQVELQEEVSLTILQSLMEGSADLGIITSAGILPNGLDAYAWREDRLLAVMPDAHPLAAESSISFDAVLDQPIIGAMEAGALALLLAEKAQQIGRSVRYRFRVASTDASRRLVAAGHGIAVMPEGVARPYQSALGIVGIPIAEPWATRQLRLVARPGKLLASSARMLLEHLLRTGTELQTGSD